MLGRLFARSAVATTAARLGLGPRPRPRPGPSCRALCYSNRNSNYWLSDKSLYPLLAITGVTVAVGVWFSGWWLHKSPEIQTPMRRRTTGQITQQKSYENIPMSKGMYEEAQDVSKGIYRVTIKDAEGSKDGEEMGKRTEGK